VPTGLPYKLILLNFQDLTHQTQSDSSSAAVTQDEYLMIDLVK